MIPLMTNRRTGTPPWKPSKMRAWRKWKGLTLAAMADLVEMNEGYLSEIETGWKKWNQDVLDKYGEKIGVPGDWLIKQDPPAKGQPVNAKLIDAYAREMASLPPGAQKTVADLIRSMKENSLQ